MKSIVYLYDPLCGWCYAAAPVIARLGEAGVALDLLPSGLFSVPGRTLGADFAAHAWRNDQRIHALTGQVFSEAYRRDVLEAVGAAFDSTLATLALTAVAMEEPAREADALKRLQEGRYVFGRDLADLSTVGAILTEAGLARAAAALRADSPALQAANRGRLEAAKALQRELGASGVPTLVLVEGSSRRLLDSRLLYGPADALLVEAGVPSTAALQGEPR